MVWSLANLGRADSHTHGGGFVCYLEEFHGTVHARSDIPDGSRVVSC